MARYKIVTLVDITRSYATRSETNKIKIGQQSNFNSLIQAIGIRSNIEWNADPIKHSGSLPRPLVGKANHWIWEFDCERDDVFLKDENPVALLIEDLDGVPIVNLLENSTDIDPSVIKTKGSKPNTWVTLSRS